jgi:hypothetical protein
MMELTTALLLGPSAAAGFALILWLVLNGIMSIFSRVFLEAKEDSWPLSE